MFCNDLREKYEEKIILKGVDAETMNILLDYTYTSKMLITKQNVQKVLEAASLFQVQITQMHWPNLTALATPCLTLVSTLQASLISWVLEAFCFTFTYIKVKNGSGSHVLEFCCAECHANRKRAWLCLQELLPCAACLAVLPKIQVSLWRPVRRVSGQQLAWLARAGSYFASLSPLPWDEGLSAKVSILLCRTCDVKGFSHDLGSVGGWSWAVLLSLWSMRYSRVL